MQRWRTPEPLPLPIDVARIARLDLEFVEVRRDLGSFTFYVFLNAEEDLPADAGRDHPHFAAAYSVFAARGCWGSEGHCDWRRGPVSPYDRRPPHHMRPFTLTLDVTDGVKALGNPPTLDVTVHATRIAEPDAEDVFLFRELQALSYQ
jgi:hypothetical protein